MLNRLLDTVTVLALIAVMTIGGRMMWERWQQNAAQRDREIDGWQTRPWRATVWGRRTRPW